MLSRGYNHRGGCACRFCQPSKAGETIPTTADLISVEGSHHSYTLPTTCPVCGEAVFFFISQHCGRVFFDELGPPWPKHPCTNDALAAPLATSASANNQVLSRRYAWQEAGWHPITEVLVEANRDSIRLRGLHNGKQLAVCILLSELDSLSDPVAELACSPIHARHTVTGVYEVAFLSSDIRPRMVAAVPDDTGRR